MAVSSRIRELDLGENLLWVELVQRIELYYAANKLTKDEHKRAVYSAAVAKKLTCSLVATLLKPSRPPNVHYRVIVDAVKNHVNSKPFELYSSVICSRMAPVQTTYALVRDVQTALLLRNDCTWLVRNLNAARLSVTMSGVSRKSDYRKEEGAGRQAVRLPATASANTACMLAHASAAVVAALAHTLALRG
ncbi:hypothetical protein HPB51_011435 [Rhipicephalus microplus]|uniref:Uncharacterized protein n=1 Tax=Rhipicephalus microplus TaxID=6941 RepID=A0A9J6EGK3_RHIMP|nr:hypothetical protein HPB51_011435 [Rhipicephalus microplus]